MSYETLLGVYHYCMAHHSGQGTREYRLLSKVTSIITPSNNEQLSRILTTSGYERSREVYESLGGQL